MTQDNTPLPPPLEPEEPVLALPSQARQDDIKRALEEARDRWLKTNNGEVLSYYQIMQVVKELEFDAKKFYLETRLKPLSRSDFNFLLRSPFLIDKVHEELPKLDDGKETGGEPAPTDAPAKKGKLRGGARA